jgi:hypothetical protein
MARYGLLAIELKPDLIKCEVFKYELDPRISTFRFLKETQHPFLNLPSVQYQNEDGRKANQEQQFKT